MANSIYQVLLGSCYYSFPLSAGQFAPAPLAKLASLTAVLRLDSYNQSKP